MAKGLGSAAQIATYAQLGVTFVSSGVNEYGKTGSIGKGVIGGAIQFYVEKYQTAGRDDNRRSCGRSIWSNYWWRHRTS